MNHYNKCMRILYVREPTEGAQIKYSYGNLGIKHDHI